MKKAPPKKQRGQCMGPRRINGFVLDIATAAKFMGVTEKTLRARSARGRVPYRRDGPRGRIFLIRDECETYLRKLPGVTVEEALENEAARRGR